MRQTPRLLLASCLWLAGTACNKADTKPAPPPPPAVKVAEAVTRDVPVYVEAVGQTRGNKEIEISARVEGFLETMSFKEGTFVKKGQVLYTIDSRPFRANLAQARASFAQSEAEFVRKHQDVARYEPLVAKNAVSVQEYETAVAQEKAQKSAVAAAQAAADRAQIELGYTTVVAPDDGLIGVSNVHPGTLVGRGSTTVLTHMSKVDPIAVRFSISERDYLGFAKRREERMADAGVTDAGANEPPAGGVVFKLILADGSTHPHDGVLTFVDRNVDATTGTILLEAQFPNPGGVVRPGQFAKVRAAATVKHGAVLIAQRSVQDSQGVTSVLVVKPDDTAEQRIIKVADRVGDLAIVDSGVKPGERIIVEGMQKVRPGAKVKPETVSLDELAGIDKSAAAKGP